MTQYSDIITRIRHRRWVLLLVVLVSISGHSLALFKFNSGGFSTRALLRIGSENPQEFAGFTVPSGGSDVYQTLTPTLLIRLCEENGFRRAVNTQLDQRGNGDLIATWSPRRLVLTIDETTGREFLELSYSGEDPATVIPVASAGLAALSGLAQSYFLASVNARRERMKALIGNQRHKYERTDEALEEVRREADLPPSEGTLMRQEMHLTQSLDRLHQTRNSILAELEQVEEELGSVERIPDDQYQIIEAVRGTPIHTTLATLSAQVVQSEIELRRLEKDKTDKHPDVIEARSNLERDQQILEEMFEENSTLYPRIEAALLSDTGVRSERRRNLAARTGALSTKLASTDAILDEKQSRLDRLRIREPEIRRLEQDRFRRQRELEALVAQQQQLDMLAMLAPEVVQVVRPPSTLKREHTELSQVIPMILILALLMGVGAVYVCELVDSRVHTIGCLNRASGLPNLGSIPDLRSSQRRIPTTDESNPALEAAHWVLMRTQSRLGDGRVVLVTSTQKGDGRSFVAMNLALSAGRSGMQTLLIDADLRRPMLHTHLRLPRRPGLCEELSVETDSRSHSLRTRVESSFLRKGSLRLRPDEIPPETTIGSVSVLLGSRDNTFLATRATEHKNVDLLSAGRATEDVQALFESTSIDALLSELRTEYQLVIVDTPPLCEVADGLLLSKHCDGVILVARASHTQAPDLAWVSQNIVDIGAPVLGTVLNGVDQRSRSRRQDNKRPEVDKEMREFHDW